MKGSHVVDRAESFAKTTVSANTVTAVVALVADASTSTVTGLTASPTSIVADGAATSTLTATVRDANGNLLPAGQTVTFTTTSGTLSANTATTNASGVASVTLKGTAAGTASITAKSTTATTRSVQVVLTSAAPVINSFTEQGRGPSGGYVQNLIVVNTDSAFWYPTQWAWSVQGADRYELVDPWGSILYSGTGTSLTWNNTSIPSGVWNKMKLGSDDRVRFPYTLKAYKGSEVTTKTLSINHGQVYCGVGCGS